MRFSVSENQGFQTFLSGTRGKPRGNPLRVLYQKNELPGDAWPKPGKFVGQQLVLFRERFEQCAGGTENADHDRRDHLSG